MNKRNFRIGLVVIIMILIVWWLIPSPSENFDTNVESKKSKVIVLQPRPETKIMILPEDGTTATRSEPPDTAMIISMGEISRYRNSVKIDLASLYTAEKVFFEKHKRYTTDLKLLGWKPEGVLMADKGGFLKAYDPHDYVTGEDPEELNTDVFQGEHTYSDQSKNIEILSLKKYCKQRCTATAKKFEVISAVNLDEDPELDVWTMNQDKEIRHVVNDLELPKK